MSAGTSHDAMAQFEEGTLDGEEEEGSDGINADLDADQGGNSGGRDVPSG